MNDLNPAAIFNDFRSGKIDKSTTINKYYSILQNSVDDEINIPVIDFIIKYFIVEGMDAIKWVITNVKSPNCLFILYNLLEANLSKESEQLRQFMELSIGRGFIDKYDLIPKEAMALELLGRGIVWDQIISKKIEYKIPAPNWPSFYKIKKGFVVQINIDNDFFHESEINSKYFNFFSRLKKLCLWDCSLNDYSNLTNLSCLKINSREQPEIYDICEIRGLEKLTNLRELDLSRNGISEIKNIKNLVNLRELTLSENEIKEIKGLSNLTQLEYLDLECNDIEEIKGLESLVKLRKLNLSNDFTEPLVILEEQIKDYPPHIKNPLEKYRDMQEKGLINKTIHYIREIKGLDNLINLEELSLSGNLIIEIKGLTKLKNLRILNLSGNKITEFKGVNSLRNLEEFHLYKTLIPKEDLIRFNKSSNFNLFY